jgi:hypothetical protein
MKNKVHTIFQFENLKRKVCLEEAEVDESLALKLVL